MNFTELKAKFAELDTAVKDTKERHGTGSDEYRRALEIRNKWESTRQDALTLIGAALLWERYKRPRRAVVVAIFLVHGGVVAFAWGANPPDDEKENSAVVLGQAPMLRDVHLTDAGVAALKKARGCDASDLQVLSVSGQTGEREVMTLPAKGCKVVRFVLTSVLGTETAAARP